MDWVLPAWWKTQILRVLENNWNRRYRTDLEDHETHCPTHKVRQHAESYSPQNNSSIGKWNEQLKHWLSKIRVYVDLKGWLTCHHVCALTLDMSKTKGMSLLNMTVFLVHLEKKDCKRMLVKLFKSSKGGVFW